MADSNNLDLLDIGNPHVFAFERIGQNGPGILVLGNFHEEAQAINSSFLAHLGYINKGRLNELIQGKPIELSSGLLDLAPYELLWLKQF